jgi:hypothetical protein
LKTDAGKALQFQLNPKRDTYTAGEPVEVELVLTNRSEASCTVNKRLAVYVEQMAGDNWEVKFDITFPPGKRLIRGALIRRAELNKDDFSVLAAGESLRATCNLSRYNWLELPGTYQVKALYHNPVDGREFGLKAWTGDVYSNSISFNITQ